MAEYEKEKPVALLKLGDRVKIRLSGGLSGKVVELRGPLGPGVAQIYRVQVRRKPEPKYIELLEGQLDLVPAKGQSPRRTRALQSGGKTHSKVSSRNDSTIRLLRTPSHPLRRGVPG